ncbi:tRNA lysidine(34) synthetase TilS [Desulfurobacterium sp.]
MKTEEKVLSTIKRFSLIKPNETVLCAVSGGPDSIALLHILNRLSRRLEIKLHAVHFNHGLRDSEADEDENFVKSICKELSIPLTIGREDIKKLSGGKNIEAVAREERYRFLQKTARNIKADKIALGHTSSDLCETVIFNLSKGSGIKGLRGFLPKRKNIIRPLFEISREEIENYLKTHNIPFRVDSSNLNIKFSRNLIRLKVIPRLKKINPSLEETILREAETLRELEGFITETVNSILKKCILTQNSFSIKLENLSPLHPFIKKALIQEAFFKLTGQSLNTKKLNAVIKLTKSYQSGSIDLKNSFKAIKTQDTLIIKKGEKRQVHFKIPIETIPFRIETPLGIFKFEEVESGDFTFPEDELERGLFIKTREGGEWLSLPFGKKKLKKFLNEKKIPFHLRDRIPLLTTDENEVIWIPGLYKKTYIKESKRRISVRYKGGIEDFDN